jgi:2-C-methyl-D-erythritol 4-phosphate cytidylyltransferase
MTKIIALIVAAGKGIRMNDPVKKQYLSVAGAPIAVHTLRVFEACPSVDEIIFVVPEADVEFCRDEIILCAGLTKKTHLIPGGRQRQDSVYRGLSAVDAKDSIVVVHDGVRPFITPKQLEACIHGAKNHGACILGVPASETLKCVNLQGAIVKTLDRDAVWLAQTPQAFRYDVIKNAHEKARKTGITGTDDACLVEQTGIEVKIIQGSRTNIKITHREDLELARILLESACAGRR